MLIVIYQFLNYSTDLEPDPTQKHDNLVGIVVIYSKYLLFFFLNLFVLLYYYFSIVHEYNKDLSESTNNKHREENLFFPLPLPLLLLHHHHCHHLHPRGSTRSFFFPS